MDLEISNSKKNIDNNSFSKELNNHINTIVYSIDRFEGEFAICENKQTGEMITIKKDLLPEDAQEGSIIKFENGTYILDISETKNKQKEIQNMVNNLFNKK